MTVTDLPGVDLSALREAIEANSIPEPNSGCWLWLGYVPPVSPRRPRPYGVYHIRRHRQLSAHRTSYIAFNGAVPDGLEICHRCDVRLCVNPEHLFAGSRSDNMRDMVSKGRHPFQGTKGADHMTKLRQRSGMWITPELVKEIRRLAAGGVKQADLSRRFGIETKHMSQIVNRRIWASVP